MDVSIVIPVKNGGDKLKRCLEMIAKQDTDLQYEVICVDSGSRDGSLEVLKQFDCKVFSIPASEFGHGKTRNYGASKGDGEFVVFITQDAIPAHEKWLDNLVKPMRLDAKIAGGFGSHLPYFEDCNIFEIRDIIGCFKQFGDKTNIITLEDKQRFEKDSAYRGYISYFSDNNSCVRHSIFKQYPYADVNFAEDQIWMRQMMELGYKKVFCYDAAVSHSHNYGLKELFTRCYDEYKGLYEIQQYRIATSYFSLLGKYITTCYVEMNYVRHSDLKAMDKFKNVLFMMARNFVKFRAGYIGGKYHLYSESKKERLDKKYSQQYKQRNA